MNIREAKVTTREEIYNFNKDTEDTVDLGSGINSNADCSQEIKKSLRLGRAAMEELGKITKSRDVSIEARLRASIPSYSQL